MPNGVGNKRRIMSGVAHRRTMTNFKTIDTRNDNLKMEGTATFRNTQPLGFGKTMSYTTRPRPPRAPPVKEIKIDEISSNPGRTVRVKTASMFMNHRRHQSNRIQSAFTGNRMSGGNSKFKQAFNEMDFHSDKKS